MRCKVLFHDNCFDGAVSAAVFTRFYRECVHADAQFEYEGLFHKAGGAAIDESVFTGDENAIVDFRYSQSSKLTWWFDHHQSAFQQPGDEAHFRADTSGKKFHDGTRKSCTKFLADTASARFGFKAAPLADLIHWGEIIDGALFSSPKMAVELAEPALRVMTVLEANKDRGLVLKLIGDLQTQSLQDIASAAYIQKPLAPLLARHQENIALVRRKIQVDRGVATFDVADEGVDSMNKFIAYYLHPELRYTVWVGGGPQRSKVSIGSNPWHPELRSHDLSKIAERYGGGGHPVVAAVSFGPKDLDRARAAAKEIIAELRG